MQREKEDVADLEIEIVEGSEVGLHPGIEKEEIGVKLFYLLEFMQTRVHQNNRIPSEPF